MFTEEILYEKLHFLRSVSSIGPNKSQPQTAVKRYIYSFKYYVFRIARQGKNMHFPNKILMKWTFLF